MRYMEKVRRWFMWACLACLTLATPSLQAATTAQINNARVQAIAWLLSNQQGDGSWRSAPGAEIQATATARQALANAGVNGFSSARAMAWLSNAEAYSVDALARQIVEMSTEGLDTQDKLNTLIGWRNRLSAWGTYDRYATTFPDTPLASSAIRSDNATYVAQTGSLLTALCETILAQKTGVTSIAGSWSYLPPVDVTLSSAGTSAIVPTVYSLLEIAAFRGLGYSSRNCSGTVYTLDAVLDDGIYWLLSQKMNVADGGFGDDGASTPLDTALAYLAIAKVRPADSALITAQDYLINAQSADGSWQSDALATALATKTLPATVLADTDSDGVPDTVEAVLGTSPVVPDSRGLLSGNGQGKDLAELGGYATAVQNSFFSVALQSTGGMGPLTWRLSSGSLPDGLELYGSSGSITGKPVTTGFYNLSYIVSDAEGNSISVAAQINVVIPEDSDGDGMADEWELVNFGSLSRNGTGDFDGDGLVDYVEYLTETSSVGASLISVNSAGVNSSSGSSVLYEENYVESPVSLNPISTNGRYVVFLSRASDIAGVDTNGVRDIFLRDRQAGTTTLVTVNSNGTDSGNGSSSQPILSADGRYVVFTSTASDLVPNDSNGKQDVFRRDIQEGQTVLVSVNNPGNDSGNEGGGWPSMSADGQYVAFSSKSTDLTLTNDANGSFGNDVFVRDMSAGLTNMASVNNLGTASGIVGSGNPVISADGQYVTFTSAASDLVLNDINGSDDVFRYEVQARQIAPVSVNSANTGTGNSASGDSLLDILAISDDGRYIVFQSSATDLIANDGASGVFVRDLQVGNTVRALLAEEVFSGFVIYSYRSIASFSNDMRFLAFTSAVALTQNDTNGLTDVYLRDLQTGSTTLVSIDAAEVVSSNGSSSLASISADGRYVSFVSNATDISGNSANGNFDYFVRDTISNTTKQVSVNMTGNSAGAYGFVCVVGPQGCPYPPLMLNQVISSDGLSGVFVSNDPSLALVGSTNSSNDVFFWGSPNGNTAPVVVDDNAVVDEDAMISIPVLANDVDPDSDGLTVSGVSPPANGFVQINADYRSVTYSPRVNWSGNDSFSYIVTDGRGKHVSGTVYVSVTNINDGPTALNDFSVTNTSSSVNIQVLANDFDLDVDVLVISGIGSPANGSIFISPDNRSINYTPGGNFTGVDSFSYTVSDGNGGSANGVVYVTVSSLADADGDGMDDAWEIANFGTLIRDGTGDFNGDGVSDLQEYTNQQTVPDGDINNDGVVDAADVVLVRRIIFGGLIPTADQLIRGDVAPLVGGIPVPDGQLNAGDLVVIKRKVLGVVDF